jgi:glycosyltransferase involved in cell wall biosynthesis
MTTPLGGRLDQPSLAETDEVRRILFIAYLFPPIGGGGVQRSAKFVRYLGEMGYEVVVVTGPGGATDHWTPEDRSLLHDVRPETAVVRIPGPEPPLSEGWRRRAERLVGIRSPFARWWVDGVTEVGRHLGRGIDLILAECAPYETAAAGITLARELRTPLVADFQDPWALDEMWLYPSALHRLRDLARMRRLLGAADGVVMNTPEAVLRVRRRFPELREKPIVSIPNGYDASDFEGPAPARDDGLFRIVHTGFLYTDDGLTHWRTRRIRRLLGGMPVPGLDLLPRSHVYLLEAVQRLVADKPELSRVIEVHLAGVLSPADLEICRKSSVVRAHGYLAHSEAIELMRSADLLFLPMQDLPAGTRAGLVPGKTYEYLASGRPILAAVPDGDARDLLAAAGDVYLCRPADVTAIANAIEHAVGRWRTGDRFLPRAPDVLAPYERRYQTRQLAALLDGVVDGGRAPLSLAQA